MRHTISSNFNKVLILKPRLDVSFKQGPVPRIRSELPPIRQHWCKFVSSLASYHEQVGDTVVEIERPLWQFDAQFFAEEWLKNYDSVYVPHRTIEEMQGIAPNINMLFYMQTVWPRYFTIDPLGWGATMSTYPFWPQNFYGSTPFFTECRERANINQSKFDQAPSQQKSVADRPYLTFLCQLPHDQTIRQNSDVSVEMALRSTLDWVRSTGRFMIVRGHPINPTSMIPLINITMSYPDCAVWQEGTSRSIYDTLRGTDAVFTVNSGSGTEAMLYDIPIFVFGRSEYDTVVNIVPFGQMSEAIWDARRCETHEYRNWYQTFRERYLFDSTSVEDFSKMGGESDVRGF
jgi:hypothetical protein